MTGTGIVPDSEFTLRIYSANLLCGEAMSSRSPSTVWALSPIPSIDIHRCSLRDLTRETIAGVRKAAYPAKGSNSNAEPVTLWVPSPARILVSNDASRPGHSGCAMPSDHLLVAKFESNRMRVGCLLIVPVCVPSADGRHPTRIRYTESPTTKIERVNAVVAQLTVSPVPTPMPVVVDNVIPKVPARRGALPEIVIQ